MNRLIDIIEKKVLEEDYTTLDLAAGLLRMIMGEDDEDIVEDSRPLRSLDDLGDYRDGKFRQRKRRTLRRQRKTNPEETIWPDFSSTLERTRT